MVELNVLTESLNEKPDYFFKNFNLVILIDQKYELVSRVNKICRKYEIRCVFFLSLCLLNFILNIYNYSFFRFQAGGVYGWIGYAFFDFNNHLFLL